MESEKKHIRVYADTSVFGGIIDKEFSWQSKTFFEQVYRKRFKLITSPVVKAELEIAPEEVKDFFDEISNATEVIEVNRESLKLRNAYLDSKIVTPKYSNDALHVALATVSNCSIIVSWNFKHIVHYDKIPLYNAVNILQGFKQISIFSPSEVIHYE